MNEIIQRLNALTTFVNNLNTGSKEISQLPESTDGIKLVAAYNQTSLQTEQFNLSEAISGFNEINDRILTRGERVKDGNDYTYQEIDGGSTFTWILGGLNFTNDGPVIITIDDADDGFYRVDIVVVDAFGAIRKIIGTESETVSRAPDLEPNTLLLDTFYIFGSVVSEPADVIRLDRKGYLNGVLNSDENKFIELGDRARGYDLSQLPRIFWKEGIYSTPGDTQDWANYQILVETEYAPVTN